MDSQIRSRARAVEAAAMLREILDGATCGDVAERRGLSRSTADRRVKAVAARLAQVVGIDGLNVQGAGFVRRLRDHRVAVLAALEQFDPGATSASRQGRVIPPAEVAAGAARIRTRSSRPAHDLALYFLSFATGLRPLEVARLQVSDYIREEGCVRCESRLRAEAAINGKERPLYFLGGQLVSALDAYLQERHQAGHGAGPAGAWRGLDPRSPLFLDERGGGYPITPNGEEGQNRFVCRPLLEIYRKIYRQADIPGLCTQSARLTLMSRMYERGADEDQVGLVLGIADRSAVREQLPRPRRELAKVLEELA
ncbi:MAG: site-specific integrase [Burkholderiaceae bacterium]|jgi:integrase|nr:site-specific integrase [Burkholderiaceae bacterium]